MFDYTAAIPTNGVNEVQTGTIGGTPTAGAASTFNLAYFGQDSGVITWSNNNTTLMTNIQAGLDVLFGASNTVAAVASMTAGIGTFTVTFQNGRGAMPQLQALTVTNNLTGTSPTFTVARTTRGKNASYRDAAAGDELIYTGTPCQNEEQTITFAGSGLGGTFTLSGYGSEPSAEQITSSAITWSATNGTLLSNTQTGLDAIYGSNNSIARVGAMTSGIGTIIVQFIGANATVAMRLMTADTTLMTGTTPAVTVASTKAGGVVASTAPPIVYINTSYTQVNPTWVPRGTSIPLSLGSPVLGTTLTLHTAADNGSDQTFTTFTNQPDVPRCLVSTPSGTTANVTAVSDYVEGLDGNNNFISETLPPYTAGAATAVTSVNAFKSVTKYKQVANGASVTITTKYSSKIGIGFPMANDEITAGFLAGVREATRPTGTPSATMAKCLVALSSALNAGAVVIQVTPN